MGTLRNTLNSDGGRLLETYDMGHIFLSSANYVQNNKNEVTVTNPPQRCIGWSNTSDEQLFRLDLHPCYNSLSWLLSTSVKWIWCFSHCVGLTREERWMASVDPTPPPL